MKRNTMTFLGNLRTGDRFCFPGRNEVWQVVTSVGNSKTAYNQFDGERRLRPYDETKTNATPVRFLRHTQFEFMDEIQIEWLEPGDVFTREENVVLELMVREHYKDQATPGGECKAVKLDGSKDIVFIPHGSEVIFIRKSKTADHAKVSDQ